MSTPPVDFGCRNATRLPRMPVRGSSSISLRPAARTRSRAGVDVVGPVGHVMQARAVALDELADRRVRAERADQLDVAVADLEQQRLDALLLDGLAVLLAHAEAARGRASIASSMSSTATPMWSMRSEHGAGD